MTMQWNTYDLLKNMLLWTEINILKKNKFPQKNQVYQKINVLSKNKLIPKNWSLKKTLAQINKWSQIKWMLLQKIIPPEKYIPIK